MDILLDPNVAYLILLGGVMLGFLAAVTPGTGMLEVGAFLCLVLVSYEVYNLSFNWWALFILMLSVVPFIFAIQKPKREWLLVLAILLLVIGSVFLFAREGGKPAVDPLLAFVTSVLIAGFVWIAVRKVMQISLVKPIYNLDEVIGQIGECKTKVYEAGSVQVGGELWSARSDKLIPARSQVRVVRRDGFVLEVEKVNRTGS